MPRQDALAASLAIFEFTGEGLNRRSHLSLALELVVGECSDELAALGVDHTALDEGVVGEIPVENRTILEKLQAFTFTAIRVTFRYVALVARNRTSLRLFAVRCCAFEDLRDVFRRRVRLVIGRLDCGVGGVAHLGRWFGVGDRDCELFEFVGGFLHMWLLD